MATSQEWATFVEAGNGSDKSTKQNSMMAAAIALGSNAITNAELLHTDLASLDTALLHTDLESIDTKTPSQYGNSQVLLTSAGGAAVIADSSCVIQKDSENRKGWNMSNSGGGKFNLYFFSGANEIMTLGELKSIYAVGAINLNTETSSVPFFHVYTKPTGVNDVSWYHSKIDYLYNKDNTIGIGEECLFYGGEEPSKKFSERKIQFNNKIVNGEGLDSEEILTIACSSNSGATINAVNITLNKLGFNTDLLARNLNLETEEDKATESTLANLEGKVTVCDTGNISGSVAVSGGTIAITSNNLATEATLTNGNQQSKCMGLSGTSQVQLKCDANGVLETSGGGGGGGGGGDASAANQTNGTQVAKIMGSENGATSGVQRQVRVGTDGRTHTVLHGLSGSYWSPVNKPLQMIGSALNVHVGLSKARFGGSVNVSIPANKVLYRQPTGHSTYSLRSVVLFGKTTNTTDLIYFTIGQSSGYNNASYPRYRFDSVQPDPNTGEFYKSFPNYSGEYISWEKANNTNVVETITVNCNGTP